MFNKILIANRGEIACRVIRTARRMGLATVAVYSEADQDALHVRAADEAVLIGKAPATESYLVSEQILRAAAETGAEALHPGYGFLSENPDFAKACQQTGVTFVGPGSETIRAMGSKIHAKDLMVKAGVPVAPGYQGSDQSAKAFAKHAKRIGYPILLKPSAGGGGKGMRLVTSADELSDAVGAAQREAQASFGDDQLLLEKYIDRPRHVEVQIFGDRMGTIVHLFDRDCSVQRRHQKVLEEAPAPDIPDVLRRRLQEAAVTAAKTVGYVSAGTVEFLYDGADDFYFMEMNTRLQVEHPVTEVVTGLDLVEWQLRVAAGEPLPLSQDQIELHGHAIEARLYAEQPDQGFLPSTGSLWHVRLPEHMEGVRVDSGVEQGSEVTPHYDPMIAKVTAKGDSREAALATLCDALSTTHVAGVKTNVSFLHALASHTAFHKGEIDTHFIDRHNADLFAPSTVDDRAFVAAGLWIRHQRCQAASRTGSPWAALGGWRLNQPAVEYFWFQTGEELVSVRASGKGSALAFWVKGSSYVVEGKVDQCGDVELTCNGVPSTAHVAELNGTMRVWLGADDWDLTLSDPYGAAADTASVPSSLAAPMPGTVTGVSHAPGDQVHAGETLMTMEAMKMEHAIKAPHSGTIVAYRFASGDQVNQGELLIEFEEDKES